MNKACWIFAARVQQYCQHPDTIGHFGQWLLAEPLRDDNDQPILLDDRNEKGLFLARFSLDSPVDRYFGMYGGMVTSLKLDDAHLRIVYVDSDGGHVLEIPLSALESFRIEHNPGFVIHDGRLIKEFSLSAKGDANEPHRHGRQAQPPSDHYPDTGCRPMEH